MNNVITCDCGWSGDIDRCRPHHEIGYPLCPSCVTTYGGFLNIGSMESSSQFRLIEEWARKQREAAQ